MNKSCSRCGVTHDCVIAPENHEWYETYTEHPFMTGYTCRKCETKCGVLDTEKPYSDAECIPKDKQ